MLEEQIMDLRRKAHNAAFSFYIRTGRVPEVLTELIAMTLAMEAYCGKYNPDWQNQPRVPAGSPDGGQWTAGGGGDGDTQAPPGYIYVWTNEPNPQRVLVPDEPGLVSVYPVEALALGLTGLPARAAVGAIEIVSGLARSIGSAYRIRRAAQAIEDYLGGKPDRAFRNPAGDFVIMKGDKKIRFDINDYSPHDGPHFHIQRGISNGRKMKWVPAGDKHWYPFRKE